MPPSRHLNSPKSNAESTIEYLQLPNYSVNVHKNLHLNETKTCTRKKCTAHGLAMMSFISTLLLGGQIGVATSDKGPPSHETRLKSALGLRYTSAINEQQQ